MSLGLTKRDWKPFPWSTTKVRLHDDARKCVVLLGHGDVGDAEATFAAFGTGFLVKHRDSKAVYVVTAAHCVRKQADAPFYLRVNTSDKSVLVHIEEPDWCFHDDPSVDAATLEVELPVGVDVVPLSMNNTMFLTPERLSVGDFGPGDQTYTVGLFHHYAGRSKNVPLVHVGHIASFPEADEKVPSKDWRASHKDETMWLEAYIVQAHVQEGASGSPVFVRKPIEAADSKHVHADDGAVMQANRRPPLGYGAVFLLGLWKGAWEINPSEREGMRYPLGYGVVVPSYKILEVLRMQKLEDARAEKMKKKPKAHGAVLVDDSLPPNEVEKRFDATLRRMLSTAPTKKPVTGK